MNKDDVCIIRAKLKKIMFIDANKALWIQDFYSI